MIAEHLIDRAAFGDHPLGRPVLGPEEHLRSTFTRDGDPRLPPPPVGRLTRRGVPGRQPRAPARGQRAGRAVRPLPVDLAQRRAEPAPSFAPTTLVEKRESAQSHLRMSYRPSDRPARARRARRAGRLLDAARRLDGLAPVRRDPRAARARATRSTRSTTPSPTCRSCSSAPGWTRRKCVEAFTRMREIVDELHTDGPSRRRSSGPRLRRRPPRPRVREHQRRGPPRRARRPSSSARTSIPTRRSRPWTRSRMDQVVEVARGHLRGALGRLRRPPRHSGEFS